MKHLGFISTSFYISSILLSYQETPQSLLEKMTLDEKIGQLFIVGACIDNCTQSYRTNQEYVEHQIKTFKVGGIIWFGNSTPEKQKSITHYYQTINKQNNNVPLWFAQDLEPNFMYRFGYEGFPDNTTLGSTHTEASEHIGHRIGTIAQELGVQIVLAPVVDINSNPDNPIIGNRSFGSEPEQVTEKAAAFLKGLQKSKVIGCIKHFPGHGDTQSDSHKELPILNHFPERLFTVEMYPFVELVSSQSAQMVMVGHIATPALTKGKIIPASLSPAIINILRSDLQFEGIIITDALDMKGAQIAELPGQIELLALQAGNDILLAPIDIKNAIDSIKNAILNNIIPLERLDLHVLKILQAKKMLGLL